MNKTKRPDVPAHVEMRTLLTELLGKLERGGDFQLGPKGRDRDLPKRIRAALKRPTE